MKALVITGSRADRNGLEVVHEALLKAGHESSLLDNLPLLMLELAGNKPDVAILGGDRIEILQAAVICAMARIPIAHIAGGDVTEGSADDRYRDAITALACIHFTTNQRAAERLTSYRLSHPGDNAYLTGSPAIDRIKQTPVLTERETYEAFGLQAGSHAVLVCVHSNTVGDDPTADCYAVRGALQQLPDTYRFAILGANADAGGRGINNYWRDYFITQHPGSSFRDNVSPQLYYSLMTHCDVMVGNSSAMLYEAPCFGIPCAMVGDRQVGRACHANVCWPQKDGWSLVECIEQCIKRGHQSCANPYGDGNSAPRIVKALEENSWRWTKTTS